MPWNGAANAGSYLGQKDPERVGTFGALAPERRAEVARLGLLALLAVSLADLANAAIVGIVAS